MRVVEDTKTTFKKFVLPEGMEIKCGRYILEQGDKIYFSIPIVEKEDGRKGNIENFGDKKAEPFDKEDAEKAQDKKEEASEYVNKIIDGKKEIFVKGKKYRWNSVYKTYNSIDNNDLLTWKDVIAKKEEQIEKSEDEEAYNTPKKDGSGKGIQGNKKRNPECGKTDKKTENSIEESKKRMEEFKKKGNSTGLAKSLGLKDAEKWK
jgi:hypothetical protein